MSVLIKNMKMPYCCNHCPFCDYEEAYCLVVDKRTDSTRCGSRMAWCPLAEIQPQGRLINADALEENIRKHICEDCEHRKGMKNGKKKIIYQIGDAPCRVCGIVDMLGYLDSAPTVIEAGVDT